MSQKNALPFTAPREMSSFKIYSRLLTYVKPYLGIFCICIIGFGLYAYSTTQFIRILENLLKIIEHNNPQDRIAIPLQVIGYTILRSLGAFMGAYFLAKISFGIIHKLRVQVFTHITRLPSSVFDTRNSNHLISVITYNINGVAAAATDAMRILLREGATVIGLFAMLLMINWKLTMAFVIIAPAIGFLVTSVAKRLRRLSNKVQTSVGDITQVTSEMINGVRVMRSFGGEAYEQQRFTEASRKNYAQNLKIVMTSAANTPLIQLIVALAIAGLIFVALTFTQTTEAASFVAYMTAVGGILQPMRRLGEVAPMILKGVAAADSVFQLLDEPTEVDQGQFITPRAQGRVQFNALSFAYPQQTQRALDAITLDVKPGEVIALVGRSGSGKTTLVNLIPRFYDVTINASNPLNQGSICIDGVPLTDYTLANLRQQIATVNQQVILFEGTVADNIGYGCVAAVSLDDIKRAAGLAYATEFILQLPNGFNTQIGEGGARLSGGQRQRLAIARAILKDAPILIMDEATSALDNESERFIQAAMQEVMKNRTTFVVAHRLSTIEHADRILVMEAGKIVEQGTHQTLLAQHGLYAKLHSNDFNESSTSP
jgi:ATP-binding cassette, subfamily B, bacterial MsbA